MKYLQIILVFTFWTFFIYGLPISNNVIGLDEMEKNETGVQNDSLKNLYVVKAVVYEIGILTDTSDEDNFTSSETQERVDLTFFDAHSNDTHIDLGRIPLPVQTNISGQVLTALAPVDLGAFSSPSELLDTLPLTGTIVNITHSDTALFQIKTTSNLTEIEQPHPLTLQDIEVLPDIVELNPEISENVQNIIRALPEENNLNMTK